jgi:hypothetical protein
VTHVSQQRLNESREKTKQRMALCEPRGAAAQSLQRGLNPLYKLHRTLGNQRVAQLIQGKRLTPEGKIIGLQQKLTAGATDDGYERETDRAARQVMNTPDVVFANSMQRAISAEEDKDQMLQTKPLAASITPIVQRQMGKDDEEDKPIQAKSTGSMSDSFEAGGDVETQVSQSKGHGNSLPDHVRAYMEPGFGVDFSHVRVDTGSDAIHKSRDVGAGDWSCGTMSVADALSQAVSAQQAPVLQRQGGGAAPACPTTVNFNFTQPAHVPHCGGPALRATTNVAGVTWSLTPGTAAVDPGTTIAANGTITLAATQAAGDINARSTAATPAAGGCFVEQPFTIRSHPVSIASTSFVAAAPAGNYGGTFDHVFDSADGNVASLDNVGVGERFTNVPNPAGATHNIVAPLNPFGGVFTLNTATLTPGATNNWFLTAAGGLGGTLDSVTTGQANINVGRFVQSASNPAPPQGLPASMTLLQRLHWFCPQRPAASRWIGFVTVPHSRTLRNVGGTVEFVTAVNAVEQVDAYVGPTAVSNLTATPVSTPRSAGPPAGGGAAPPARTIAIKADTLPAALPAGQTITWSIVGNALGCTIAQDPADDHSAVLTIGMTAGTATVEATDSTSVNRARVAVVIT